MNSYFGTLSRAGKRVPLFFARPKTRTITTYNKSNSELEAGRRHVIPFFFARPKTRTITTYNKSNSELLAGREHVSPFSLRDQKHEQSDRVINQIRKFQLSEDTRHPFEIYPTTNSEFGNYINRFMKRLFNTGICRT